jgi:glycyl-tRNA synthetase beta chain
MKTVPGKNALLEIGTEEIPARFLKPALTQISQLLEQGLKTAGVTYSKIDVYGTPRRMAALITNLSPRSSDREDVALGPPPKAAKTESGEWTPAALGFAKAQKIPVEKLVVRESPKGERLAAIHIVKGQKTEQVLKDLFPSIIRSLQFPKSMVWDESQFRFPRPIRWFVSLYNGSVVRFKLGDVTSDRKTIGLLALGGQRIPISKPEKYKSLLQGRCILVDPEERKKNILNQLESISKKNKASAIWTPEHLDEVVFLTEYPSSILGKFPEEYLKLPREILITVLRKHQKFFPALSPQTHLEFRD